MRERWYRVQVGPSGADTGEVPSSDLIVHRVRAGSAALALRSVISPTGSGDSVQVTPCSLSFAEAVGASAAPEVRRGP